MEELDSWLSEQDFGGDIKYGFQGQAEETEEVNELLGVAGGTANFVMLLIMVCPRMRL